jgi:hypothetical protein
VATATGVQVKKLESDTIARMAELESAMDSKYSELKSAMQNIVDQQKKANDEATRDANDLKAAVGHLLKADEIAKTRHNESMRQQEKILASIAEQQRQTVALQAENQKQTADHQKQTAEYQKQTAALHTTFTALLHSQFRSAMEPTTAPPASAGVRMPPSTTSTAPSTTRDAAAGLAFYDAFKRSPTQTTSSA